MLAGVARRRREGEALKKARRDPRVVEEAKAEWRKEVGVFKQVLREGEKEKAVRLMERAKADGGGVVPGVGRESALGSRLFPRSTSARGGGPPASALRVSGVSVPGLLSAS